MEKQFYLISAAVGTKETGMVYPSLSYVHPADGDHPYSLYKINSLKLPLYTPKLEFELNKGAKACDILNVSSSALGLFINEKLLNILLKFRLSEHKIFPATVRYKDIILPYFWVQFIWPESISFIDFKNSEFSYNNFDPVTQEYQRDYFYFNDYYQFQAKQDELGGYKMIDTKKIKLKTTPFDLFAEHLSYKLYSSEELKKAIELNGITGIDIAEIS